MSSLPIIPAPITDIKLRELLAFQLFAAGEHAADVDVADAWRAGPAQLWQTYRAKADQLQDSLHAAGVRLAVGKVQKLDQAIEDITTIPARKAYTLE